MVINMFFYSWWNYEGCIFFVSSGCWGEEGKEEVLEGIFLFYIHCTLRINCSFSMIFFMIFHFLFPVEVQSF